MIEGDARGLAIGDIAPGGRAVIIANLPYNIATFLLLGWLGECQNIARMVLMLQKEVAVRLAAQPGEKAYGRLSVVTQWCCDVNKLFDVPPGAFTPPPRVSSRVMRLTPAASSPLPGTSQYLGAGHTGGLWPETQDVAQQSEGPGGGKGREGRQPESS